MNKQNETQSDVQLSNPGVRSQQPRRRGRLIKGGIALALLGALAVTGLSYANNANSGDGDGCHGHAGMHGHFGMHGPMGPAKMSEHVDHMVNHVLSDSTPEQKAKVEAILKAALNDLQPLHAQHKAAHDQVVKLMTQPTIDRDALEKVRASEIQLADQASKRVTRALEDAGDVLTPQQRIKLAEHFGQHMG